MRGQSAHVPYGAHPAIADPALPEYVRDWILHREPGEYWSEQDISKRIDRIQIPALHIAGWFDTYLKGSIAGYLALRSGAGSEFARQNQYLIAGPWVHIPWGDRAGETNLGEAANIDTDEILLRWFNHWLKDAGEFECEPRVRYFALGSNEWRKADEWPTSAAYALYLHSGGNANSRKGDGGLKKDAPRGEQPRDVFVYDPEVPVPAPGGPQALSGPFDQAAGELGNNLLVYTTEPVKRSTEIVGQARVRLFAATSAAHADFTAKIVRVTANGRAEFLCIGVARSSWLFGDADYAADRVHAWEFSLEPIAFVLAAG
jgi:putative CocE/NonD family hydrolase